MSLDIAATGLTSRNRPLDHEKRVAIMEAARALFTTKGYESTTIADVAKQAAVAVGTVYIYFKNKSDLLYAVKGEWDAEFLSFMARPEIQAIPYHLRARPLIEAAFAICEQHTDMVQLMGLQPEMLGEWYTKDASTIQQALQAMFQEAQESGDFRPTDTKAAAVIAYGMVNQALIQCFVVEGGKEKERYITALVDALERWLLTDAAGVKNDGGRKTKDES
jgi:AcrR family transcriptional regulator